MQATFRLSGSYEVHIDSNPLAASCCTGPDGKTLDPGMVVNSPGHVLVAIALCGPAGGANYPILLPKSEARAIASALMGAAADA